jgi:hypothetical protein
VNSAIPENAKIAVEYLGLAVELAEGGYRDRYGVLRAVELLDRLIELNPDMDQQQSNNLMQSFGAMVYLSVADVGGTCKSIMAAALKSHPPAPVGNSEGETCNRDGCTGIIKWHRDRPCRCHISPPCSACVDAVWACSLCDWREDDEQEGATRPLPRVAIWDDIKPGAVVQTAQGYEYTVTARGKAMALYWHGGQEYCLSCETVDAGRITLIAEATDGN